MLMPFSNFLEKLNSTSKHYFVFVCLFVCYQAILALGQAHKASFKDFPSFSFLYHFSFFSILLPVDTQRVFVMGFNIQMCHLLTLR